MYMLKYKLRAECEYDIDILVGILNVDVKKVTPCYNYFPNIEIEFESIWMLEDLRDKLEMVEDTDTMVETLNYKDKYSGERWY